MSKPARALVVVGLASIAVGTLAALAPRPGGAASPDGATDANPPADRVLVVSIPTLSWADLDLASLPNLNGLLDESAIADLSVRGVRHSTNAGDGYVTLGAGTRARGSAVSDGLAFQVDERYGSGSAEDAFERRTGRSPEEAIFSLALPAVAERNDDLRYGAEVGALGDALAAADVNRAVIANADRGVPGVDVTYGREAVLGLMDSEGVVPSGRVNADLLLEDPEAAFGTRYDLDAVMAAFDDVWEPRSVVLVEASDLVRADAYRPFVTPEQRRAFLVDALEATDELVGQLLERVDPETDAVVVVGPYHARSRVHLTVAGLRAPGLEPGLLRSASTRRSGFVSLVDVGPTVLELLDVNRPSSMEGRPFERGATGGDATERREFLIEANRAASFRDRMVTPVTTAFVVFNVVLSFVAGLVLLRPRRALQWVVAGLALTVLGFLPATYLAGAIPFYRLGDGWYWSFLFGVGIAIALAAIALGRASGRWIDPLVFALGAVLGLQFVDVLRGAPLQLNTVFGYSPTVAGRFAGFGNLAFAQISSAAILLAALLAHRVGGRRGAVVGVTLLLVTLVLVGMPMWGSDVGGVLTLVSTTCVMATLLFGWRVRLRSLLAWAGATLAAIALFGAFDLARPPDRRTHLGRLIEQVRDEGFHAFETVVLRKLFANLTVLTRSDWILMVPLVFVFLAVLVWRAPGRLRNVRDVVPELRAALVGLMVAGALGFALNDSGIAVPGLMLGVVNGSLVFLVLRVPLRSSPAPDQALRRPPAPEHDGDEASGGRRDLESARTS